MSTTRFTNGVTNVTKQSNLGAMGQLDPTKFHTYFNDFDAYNAAEWVITTVEAGAGSATEALTDADGGVLLVTNAAGDDDSDFFNKVGESFTFDTGKKLWFKSRFKLSDVTDSDCVIGLQITDTSPLAVSDGVFFIKNDDAATVTFRVSKDSADNDAAAITTMVNDTYVELGYYYNGSTELQYFVDDVKIGTLLTADISIPDDEELTISFGVQNGAAAAKNMSIDYIFVAKER